jgi:hypothetical protein
MEVGGRKNDPKSQTSSLSKIFKKHRHLHLIQPLHHYLLPAIVDKSGFMANLFEGIIKTVKDVSGGVEQVSRFVVGSAVRTAENAVDTAVEAGKVVSTVPFTFVMDHIGHEGVILETARKIFKGADDEPQKKLINEVLERAPGLINLDILLEAAKNLIGRVSERFIQSPVTQLAKEVATSALSLAESAVRLAEPDVLWKASKGITASILNAFVITVGKLPFIKAGILSNKATAAILGHIWSERATLARFIIDLIEPAKGYVKTNLDGTIERDDVRGKYNELDFSDLSNGRAAISQLQRFAMSIIFLLIKMATALDNDFNNIDMTNETRLASDVELGKTIDVSPATGNQRLKEKWLFVNGIAGELSWLRLACQKLADRYSREVTGVFNRGDGILWDLIECGGERSDQGTGSVAGQRQLVQRTVSSKRAQEALKNELKKALEDGETADVVMIAHSQGCLLLRLALEELVNGSETLRNAMKNRLHVYTFGNPSLDWNLERAGRDSSGGTEGQDSEQSSNNLSSYSIRTEHFANKEDFVAKLGVLSTRTDEQSQNAGYPNSSVFINSKDEWRGHLFASQYSLDQNDYDKGDTSWLLTCQPGQSIRH